MGGDKRRRVRWLHCSKGFTRVRSFRGLQAHAWSESLIEITGTRKLFRRCRHMQRFSVKVARLMRTGVKLYSYEEFLLLMFFVLLQVIMPTLRGLTITRRGN